MAAPAATSTALPAEPARLRALLHQHGLRCTTPRMAVLRLLTADPAGGQHHTAPAIHEHLTAAGSPADLATVYRTLTMLTEVGLVHSIAGPDHAAAFALTDRPHHHALCSRCGHITGIPAEDLTAALDQAQRVSSYTLDGGSLTLRGMCPSCRNAAPSND